MLYHTSFGNPQTALVATRNLLRESFSISNTTDRLSKQVRIAFALKSCSQLAEASRMFEDIYAEALRENLGSAHAFALWRLSSIELDVGNINRAEYWLDRFMRAAPIDREPLAAMILHWHSANVAVCRKNVTAAEYHLGRAQASMPESGHLMRHAALTATALGIERLRGNVITMRSALEAAIPIYELSRKSLGQYPLATEIALCYWTLGEEESARTVFSEYVEKYRREPPPYPFPMHQAAGEIGMPHILIDSISTGGEMLAQS